jgi:DNA-binding Lrp family transcriptional regulator
MPKSSRAQIKEDEKKVINQLLTNANESIDKIAKKCGFSRQKVWRIIKRLEEDYTIWGYTAIVDDEKQGVKHFIALVKRTNIPVDEKMASKVATEQFQDMASKVDVLLESTLYVHGVYDWLISFAAKDIVQAKKFTELINHSFHGYIADLQLLETIFPVRKQRIVNPDMKKLKEFL